MDSNSILTTLAAASVPNIISLVGYVWISGRRSAASNALVTHRIGALEETIKNYNGVRGDLQSAIQVNDQQDKAIEEIKQHCKERKQECIRLGISPDRRASAGI